MERFLEKYRQGDFTDGSIPSRPADFSEAYLRPPVPLNEARRNKTLYYYRLGEEVRESLRKVVSLASRMFDVSSILINFLDQTNQIIFQTHNFPVGDMARDISFCGHGILTPKSTFTVPDTYLDWRFQKNPLVTQDDGIRFYAGAPIIAESSSLPNVGGQRTDQDIDEPEALGMVCLLDKRPRADLTEGEDQMLRNLSDIVRDILNGHLKKMQLEERNAMSRSIIRYIDSIESKANPFATAEHVIGETLALKFVQIYELDDCSIIPEKDEFNDNSSELRFSAPLPHATITESSQMVTIILSDTKQAFTLAKGQCIWESDGLKESAMLVPFTVGRNTYLIACFTADPHRVFDVFDVNYLTQFAQTITVHVQQSLIIQTNDVKTSFIKSVSHELRTPLHGILTSAELLLEDIPARYKSLAEMIQLSGKNLINVVNGLLDLNRWEAQSVRENKEAFDALDLQQEIADSFAFSQTDNRAILLEADIKLWGNHVIADRGIIKQILLNIVDNAIKFTAQGSVKISLKVRRSDNEQMANGICWLDCHIEDTGKGMTAGFLHSFMFRPFQKEDEFTQGLGLSMAVSKHLANATNASLEVVSSKPGIGTDILLSFPVVLLRQTQHRVRTYFVGNGADAGDGDGGLVLHSSRGEGASIEQTLCERVLQDFFHVQCSTLATRQRLRVIDFDASFPPDSQTLNHAYQTILLCRPDSVLALSEKIVSAANVVVCIKPVGVCKVRVALKELKDRENEQMKKKDLEQTRILIVDDNAVNRNILAVYCRKRKLYYETACDGLEAIDKFSAGRFNVVFMDIQMPLCDGPTAVREIRKFEKCNEHTGCTIVMLTGLNPSEMQDTSNNIGANALYAKPVSLKTLDTILGI